MPAAAVIRASIGENEMAEYVIPASAPKPATSSPPTVMPSGFETIPPADMGAALAADAAAKAKFGTIHLIIRGFLCTPFLAYGAATVFAMVAAGIPLGAAGLVFPAGYTVLSFLGLEMATGSFATMPIGMYAGTVTPGQLARNWTWTLTGNLLGGIFFAWLLWFSFTRGGTVAIPPHGLFSVIAHTAGHKASYIQNGTIGWCAAIGM